MSSRGRRFLAGSAVVAFSWDGEAVVPAPAGAADAEPAHDFAAVATPALQLASLERDAYSRGFSQGETAGLQAAATRSEAMLRQLTATLAELTTLRTEMIRQTERQMVELALAIARRIVMREVTIDHDLLIAMARVALERLGECTRITVRLHPDEYEATNAGRVAEIIGSNVMVLADPRVGKGGCRVESDLGALDAGIDAQIQELGRALLGDIPPPRAVTDAAPVIN
jgi:flagellar assembly protein FliH